MELAVDDNSFKSFLICQIGDKKFGIDVYSVQEVTSSFQITPVYLSGNDVVGVINLRGSIVTVLNCRNKLRSDVESTTLNPKVVIVDCEKETIGLMVDETIEIFNALEENISPPPDNVEDDQIELIDKVCIYGDEVIAILDLQKMALPKE